jgi:hypothetical protein
MLATAMVLALAATQTASPGTPGAPAAPPIATLPPPSARPGGAPASGVTSYPFDFFAASQPNTARDMVDRLPGFVFDDGDSVRGFAGAAGNVLIDGARPASKTDDLDAVLRRIPASRVNHIDIIRGGAPGIDMQGKTVIANVVRKTDAATTGLVAAANQFDINDGRQNPTVRLEATRRAGETSVEGSLLVSKFADDGAGDGPETATGPGRKFAFANHDNTVGGGGNANLTGAYTTSLLGGSFRLNLQLFGQQYIYDERDQNSSSLSLPPTLDHQHQNKEQSELGLTYDHNFGPKLATETLFIQQVQGEDFLDHFRQPGVDDRFREQHTNGESILRFTATYNPTKDLTIEAGGEGDYNWLDSHTGFVADGLALALPAANVQVKEMRGEAFAKATWVINPKLTAEVGLRIEASHLTSSGDVIVDNTFVYPKPRMVLTWSPDEADQFRARVEEEVGQLDFNYFVANSSLTTGKIFTGNPNLTPQQALVYEAAYERRFWGKGDVSITYRHSNLTSVIDRAPVVSPAGDFDQPANIGGGTKDELITAVNLPLDRFGIKGGLIRANATWRHSRVTDPTTGRERALGLLRPREGEIDFSQDLPQWRLNWGGTYNMGWRQPYYDFNQVEVDNFRPYGTVFVEYRPRPGLSLRGEVDDIGADFRRTLEIFPDLRSTTAQQLNDIRSLYFGPTLYFRVRQQI